MTVSVQAFGGSATIDGYTPPCPPTPCPSGILFIDPEFAPHHTVHLRPSRNFSWTRSELGLPAPHVHAEPSSDDRLPPRRPQRPLLYQLARAVALGFRRGWRQGAANG